MKNRILVACVGVPLIFLVLYVLPLWVTPAMLGILAAVGTYEAMSAIGMNHPRIALYTAALALALPFWVNAGCPRAPGMAGLLVYLILIFIEAFASGMRVRIERVGGAFFFAVFISGGLSAIASIGTMTETLRTSYILLPIALPFVCDAAAMLTGMFLGKHKFTPNLSPKKTVEGAVGGLVGAVVLCVVYGLIMHAITEVNVNYYFLIVYGVLGGAISQMGDLAFSYVKRTRKIKDFGAILPGHGGVLDRFDSVIFCAPLVELLIEWLPAFKL